MKAWRESQRKSLDGFPSFSLEIDRTKQLIKQFIRQLIKQLIKQLIEQLINQQIKQLASKKQEIESAERPLHFLLFLVEPKAALQPNQAPAMKNLPP